MGKVLDAVVTGLLRFGREEGVLWTPLLEYKEKCAGKVAEEWCYSGYKWVVVGHVIAFGWIVSVREKGERERESNFILI